MLCFPISASQGAEERIYLDADEHEQLGGGARQPRKHEAPSNVLNEENEDSISEGLFDLTYIMIEACPPDLAATAHRAILY